MNIQIIYVKDADGMVTDIVGLSDYAKANKLAQELSNQFGRFNVFHTSLVVDELPAFFGNTPPSEAAEQLRALDLPCAECGEVFEAHKYNNCGHEFVNANKPAAQQSFAADSNPAEPVVSAMDMDDIRNPRYKSGR